ncbi:MAG: branched-chain amino acid aminotransferase [Chitinivibrionales bacterium]|nr:branched-chain amino acid aminotransferase [Chitinivibrionales bacterium]
MAPSIDWRNLGFEYMQTNFHVHAEYKNGSWGELQVCSEPYLSLHIGATPLHYGQACFEGMKAFNRKDGTTALFRPRENAQRMINSAKRLVMAPPPEELFIEAVKLAIEKNREFVPPYGTGASLYVRPLLIGTTPRIGLQPSEDFALLVLVMPVGPYYKDGFYPVKAKVHDEFDRAAPLGVGNVKVAGNYASALYPDMIIKKQGYPIALYLDSATRNYIDEFGTSNFFGITQANTYVTPDSTTVLPSITNKSLQQLAADFGMEVERRPVKIDECELFKEAGACGTAAVITPIYSITHRDKTYTFGEAGQAGETLTKLYNTIQDIQYGDIDDPHNWMEQAVRHR